MRPKAHISQIPVYKPGKPIEEVKKEYQLTEVIKLASNENPFGPSPKAREAAISACADLGVYPDGGGIALRSAIAQFYSIDTNQIILGNGSDEVVQMISRTFLSPGTNTVMAAPSFPMYKINADIEGAEAIEVPLVNGVHNLEEMSRRINDKTQIVWLCNPNNPTGTYNNQDEVLSFLQRVPQDVLVVLDEAYYEYVAAADYPDSLPLLEQYPNLMILRTFSKVYGLASLRIGYGIASPELIQVINGVREPFNANRVAQAAALAALSDQDYMKHCFEQNRAGLAQYEAAFEEMGLSWFPSQANFIMVDTGVACGAVFEALLKQGLIIRQDPTWGYPYSVRITIGSEEQNNKMIAALKASIR